VNLRKSQIELLALVTRCGVSGFWHRGKNAVFEALDRHKLIADAGDGIGPKYKATELGRATLAKLGICPLCGGHGTWQQADPRHPWSPCHYAPFHSPPVQREEGDE